MKRLMGCDSVSAEASSKIIYAFLTHLSLILLPSKNYYLRWKYSLTCNG